MARNEKSPSIEGKAARRTLYFMSQEMTDNQCIFLAHFANLTLFGGKFDEISNTTYRDYLIDCILSGLEACHNEDWLDLIRCLLNKTPAEKKEQATI